MQDLDSPIDDQVSKHDETRHYELTFEERPGYLYAHVTSGEITAEAALDYLIKIVEKCDDANCERILLERDIPHMLPFRDLYEYATKFREMFGDKKLAIVNPHTGIFGKLNF